ncbi:MAG: hypothetical protein ACRDQV_04035 [Pseudonocardiaceae bacterium]
MHSGAAPRADDDERDTGVASQIRTVRPSDAVASRRPSGLADQEPSWGC